jgi:hypothetical protein
LVQVTEEEEQISPSGDSKVVRATSNPDTNGNLQLVQREIEETKKTSADTEETKTTVMLPSVNGGLAPAMQTQERRKHSGDNVVEFQKTTLLPDGAGNWQVGEVKQGTAKHDGKNRSTEERVSRPDSAGKLGEISRTVSKQSETASGEKRKTVETYSTDVPGSAPDGSSGSARNHRPAHQFIGSANHGAANGAARPGRSGLRSAGHYTNHRRGAFGPCESGGHANHSGARRQRRSWSRLRGYRNIRQRSCHSGSDSAFHQTEIDL